MAASWDRESTAYREDWLPRLTPYHADLVSELALHPGQSALSTPELEPLVARAVGSNRGKAPWDAIASTTDLDAGWSDALATHGKVGVLVWGPDDPDDPLALLERTLASRPAPSGDRTALARRFHEVGLVLVRHTIVRHTISFPRAEQLATAAIRACRWRANFEAQGEAKCGKALARFYDAVGGPDQPLAWEPAAAVAIAGLPGAEIELPHRPSVKIPL
jgi:hypothetical protein